jgi:Mg-chelatase subunit ChlD
LKAYSDGQKFVRLQVQAKDVEECPPVDLFCCVDVSGSMGSSCAGQTDGRTEYVENGFSLLDLVRHALKTVIQTLRPQDRLSIITFNNNAQTRIQIQNMSEEGKKLAYACAESISHGGGTNMQKAITYSVLEVLNRQDKSRNPSILFFTDGQSQVNLEEF